jgi:L-fucono-1,5-lactonase
MTGDPVRMDRVDAHHHLWDTAHRTYPWMDGSWADPLRRTFTPEDLDPLARAHGVAATVVVQAVSDPDETRELLALTASSPLIAGVVGWVDLTAADVADRLDQMRSGPGGERLVGVRHQVQDEPDARWLLRPDVREGLRAIGEAGMAYDLLLTPLQLPAAVQIVRELPDVRFVVDHLAKPAIAAGMWEPWASGLAELAAAGPHVTAKLSGLVTEADWAAWSVNQLRPYVQHALECFGPRRLMFGSDWPVCLLAAGYEAVVDAAEALLADLGDDERWAVFADTAREVYRLPGDD